MLVVGVEEGGFDVRCGMSEWRVTCPHNLVFGIVLLNLVEESGKLCAWG